MFVYVHLMFVYVQRCIRSPDGRDYGTCGQAHTGHPLGLSSKLAS